jgi:2-polyprenyl-3-methyl-5-hydroxy-6-metoxy-1,4-benzoquinol methylase
MSSELPVRLEDVDCPNGCARGDDFLFTARDRLHDLPGEFRVVRCRSCGLMRTNTRPTPETMGFYYPDDYGPYLSTRVAAKNRRLTDALRRAYYALLPNHSRAIPPIPPGRMLEIGCASGAFMVDMAAAGWQVEGIEFSDRAAAAARAEGLVVHTGSVESVDEVDAPFDLVAGWMVVEHLHEPVAALSKLARWTRPGGWLAISVPNAASLDFRWFGSAWYALHIPNHLVHFEPATLTLLLDKAGWKVERLVHHRNLGNWIGGFGNKLEDWGAPRWLCQRVKRFPDGVGLLTVLLYPVAWLMAALGQTGRMTVWARRRDEAAPAAAGHSGP